MQDGLSYNHQTVVLDGENFSNCEFAACRLVYSGGEPPKLESCRFTDCEWKFEGPAADTLASLKLMWSVGAKPAVQSLIKEITVAAR
ncbi:MAG: hypothetical protein ABIO39_11495 [Caulobacteraceae bacterium]